jgi:hypothetical protein
MALRKRRIFSLSTWPRPQVVVMECRVISLQAVRVEIIPRSQLLAEQNNFLHRILVLNYGTV